MANNSSCFVLFVLAIACLAMIQRGAAEPVFNVMDYEAAGDGQTDDAMSFIQAFKAACNTVGPSRILVPGGKVFSTSEMVFQGPCKSKPITVEIHANLSAVSDPSAYSRNTWLLVDKVDGIKFTGSGTFNGNGPQVWKYATQTTRLPVSLILQQCPNSEISHLTFIDSMGFHSKVTDSTNVKVYNVTILAPDESPNTDGIHLTNCTNLNITDSFIGTGDDCISIGDGNINLYIARIFCGPGHGLSIGSLGKYQGETDVIGITIENCTLTRTTNGARIKSYHDSPKLACTKVIYKDLIMNEVKNPIIIDQHYDSKRKPKQSNVAVSDVKFINIKGTTISKVPILLNCSSAFPCTNILLSNIDLKPTAIFKTFGSACSSAKFTISGTVVPPMPRCI